MVRFIALAFVLLTTTAEDAVTVRVTDPDGNPIPNARVTVSDDRCAIWGTVTTDERGECQPEDLRDQLGVEVWAKGFVGVYVDAALRKRAEDVVPIQLERAGSVRVRALDADGNPAGDLKTFYRVGWGRLAEYGRTCAETGEITFQHVPPGKRTIRFRGPRDLDYGGVTVDVKVGEMVEAEFRIPRPVTITGMMLVDGVALDSGWVELFGPSARHTAEVDHLGRFQVDVHAKGKYTAYYTERKPHIGRHGIRTPKGPTAGVFNVDGDTEARLEVHRGWISGVVVDSCGRRLKDVKVWLVSPKRVEFGASVVQTGDDGKFEFGPFIFGDEAHITLKVWNAKESQMFPLRPGSNEVTVQHGDMEK